MSAFIGLNIRESVSSDNRLSGNTSDGAHSKTTVQKFRHLLLFEGGLIRGFEGVPSEVTRFTFSLSKSLNGRGGDKEVEKTNPKKKLVHRTSLQESIVGINCLGDGLERVHLTRKTNEVSCDKSHNCKHCSTTMTDLSLTEEGKERRVGLRQFKL